MCGIFGELAFEPGDRLDAGDFARLTHRMARRGPDDDGFWSDGVHCDLGFHRLSILDLSPLGHQPMTTPDGRYALVFNGEVYNFRELRAELQAQGVRFRSTGDTEVVLHALVEWGVEALGRFNGMFALGFYDRQTARLLLARDPVGIKPLYYAVSRRGVVFASQYDQILHHPWLADAPVSADGLGLYLRLGHIPAPYAILENTWSVAPGTCVAVDREGRDERIPYYAFPRFVEPDLKGEDAMAAFDEALTKAVRRHLVSDVPVGCFLSGGVDSPLVAAKTAALAGPVPAFTIGTGGELDESADAATYATSLHLGHTVEHLTQPAAVKLIGDFVAACGEPFADVSILPTLFLSELAARHVKVVLSGDGGDELFWGYAGRFIAALERFEQFQQNRWIRRARWAARHVLHPGRADAGFFGTLGEWYRNKHTRLRAPWLKRVFPDIAAWPEQCDGFDYRVLNRDEAAQWLRWNEFVIHLPMVLQKVDRASMFHSLEVRVPFLDREVIDVATRIRWSDCLDVQRGIGKIPLRRSLERHLKFQTIRKRGFGIDINQWIAGPLRGAVEEHVLTRRDLLGLPVRRGALQRMFREHCEGAGRHGPALWTILALCLWCDRHGHPVVPGVRQAARMPAREAVAVSP